MWLRGLGTDSGTNSETIFIGRIASAAAAMGSTLRQHKKKEFLVHNSLAVYVYHIQYTTKDFLSTVYVQECLKPFFEQIRLFWSLKNLPSLFTQRKTVLFHLDSNLFLSALSVFLSSFSMCLGCWFHLIKFMPLARPFCQRFILT